MGYFKHNAIIVTCWNPEKVKEAKEKADKIFEWVSPISPETMNSHTSFYIPPDGSKEGWDDSNTADLRRIRFMNWIREHFYEDGGNYLCAVDVGFDENGEGQIEAII